jgi:hypothetical protein
MLHYEVTQFFLHTYIHTVRTENANGYCEFVDINYRQFVAKEQNKMAVNPPCSRTVTEILPGVKSFVCLNLVHQ